MAYQAGQKLGNYQLQRLLGQGGFAEVYLGKHIYLHTQAAIKVLHRQLSDETLEMFLREAQIIASLKHPHIVGVLEFGIEEQRPFLVMTYAPYGTLRRRYKSGQVLPPTSILPSIQQIADALQYAHDRKIIHRDVKPENMLLNEHNMVLLSDFGLALRERSTYRSVHSKDSAGTTVYMAPEQLRGKPGLASDQYALGVVMYEWLCGCLPFDGPDISIVVQHLHEPPTPLREHVPTLSAEVEGVVLKALAKDPTQRFATVRELAEAFAEACKDLPIPENVATTPLIDAYAYESDDVSADLMGAQHEFLSDKRVELQVDPIKRKISLHAVALSEASRSSHSLPLQAPSLSASLDVNTSVQNVENMNMPALKTIETIDDASIPPPIRTTISRRKMLVGIAGIGIILGGVGVWHFSSNDMGRLSQNVQAVQKVVGTVPSGKPTPDRQVSGKSGKSAAGGSSPATGNNGVAKSGTTNADTSAKSGSTAKTSTSSTPSTSSSSSSSNNPAPISTPGNSEGSGTTPVATNPSSAPQAQALTVQISNPPASVANRAVAYISVVMNAGHVSFQFEADYSGLKNANKQQSPAIVTGVTDGTGAATVSWTPSLPPGQVVSGTYAEIYVVATDQNGNSVSSQHVQVLIR